MKDQDIKLTREHPEAEFNFRFIMQRKCEDLTDPHLVELFSQLRRSEVRQLVFLIVGTGGLGVAYIWLHWWIAP